VSQPTPQDPESRRFQPVSYELAPEFSAGPAAPQDPPVPAYPPPGHPQPATGGHHPTGYPPADVPYAGAPTAPRKRGKGWIIALSVVGIVLLGCCGTGAAIVAPFVGEYPATVDAPAHLAGMDKLRNPQSELFSAQMAKQLKRDTSADTAVAGQYATPGDPPNTVVVVAATGLIFSPGKEVASAFHGMEDGGLVVTDQRAYDAGRLGGVVRCGLSSNHGDALSVCVWGDHGSVGLALFQGREVAESARLFVRIREEMVKRG
jgi:hypothetical protein